MQTRELVPSAVYKEGTGNSIVYYLIYGFLQDFTVGHVFTGDGVENLAFPQFMAVLLNESLDPNSTKTQILPMYIYEYPDIDADL